MASDTNIEGIASSDNGKPLNFKEFRTFLFKTRAEITNRQLHSQSFVIARADKEGKAGQVAHTSHWTGEKEGESLKGTIVSVLKVDCVPGKHRAEWTRTVKTESFVLSVEKVR